MSEPKKIKPSLSKGTRDFLPAEVAKRNYIFETIKTVLRKYGFEEIETPAIEKLETLTGKYGEEGDKLLFKILNSGDYFSELRNRPDVRNYTTQELTSYIAEKGLRYDLTVPLARYVVQHQDEIVFPFRRFHIGPVWRADRPQKGRYQEFYQCDADIIGSNSLLNEVELTKIYVEVFNALKIRTTIFINNRKVLKAIAKKFGVEENAHQFFSSIDAYDKLGMAGVISELDKKGIIKSGSEKQEELVSFLNEFTSDLLKSVSWDDQRNRLRKFFPLDVISEDDINEIYHVGKYFEPKDVAFNPILARGLDYYTGTIWETVIDYRANYNISMGSLGGGGRYDNLTEIFGGQNMSGVGISFGIERIYDVMDELNLFPETISKGVKILFVPRYFSTEEFSFSLTQQLRDAGISAEIFLGNLKKQKQFTYAERKNISYLAEVGSDEMNSGTLRVRNLKTRTEEKLTMQQLIEKLR